MRYLKPTLTAAGTGLVLVAILFRVPFLTTAGVGLIFIGVGMALPRRDSKTAGGTEISRTARALLLAISCLAAFAVLELGVRVLAPPPAQSTSVYQPHPKRIFTPRPGSEGAGRVQRNDGTIRTVPVTVSPQGFRDREYGPKAADEFRILMLGDSFTWGFGLTLDETIPKVLERRLASAWANGTVSVINGGVEAYAPWQEYDLLLEKGFALEPDLVLLQLFPDNDVDGMLEEYDEYLEAYLAEWKETLRIRRHRQYWPMRVERWLREHVAVYGTLVSRSNGEVTFTAMLEVLRFGPSLEVPPLPRRSRRNASVEIHLDTYYPELERAWNLLENTLAEIDATCRARGVRFGGFGIPSRDTVLDEWWEKATHPGMEDGVEYDRGKGMEITRALFDRMDIPYLDLWPLFQDDPAPEDFYYVYDGHLNPAGAEFVAERLVEFLETSLGVHGGEIP